jgi:hypothetical protein
MRRLAGTAVLVGPIVGGAAAVAVMAVPNPLPRVLLILGFVGLGFGLWRLLNRPSVKSRQVSNAIAVTGLAVATLLVFALQKASDVAWLIVVAILLGLLSPTAWRILRSEWRADALPEVERSGQGENPPI